MFFNLNNLNNLIRMKSFRQTCVFLCFLLSFSLAIRAEEAIVVTLEVWTHNGEKIIYGLNERPVVTYSGDNLVITTEDISINYPLADLHKFTFGTSKVSRVDEVSSPAGKIQQQDKTLIFNDFSPNEKVSIYNIDGRQEVVCNIASDGSSSISISSLSAGVYIVKTKSIVHKILIKR